MREGIPMLRAARVAARLLKRHASTGRACNPHAVSSLPPQPPSRPLLLPAPCRPKAGCCSRRAHSVDGRDVPGSRWGIDNPDSVYRVIPISGEERYEIRGRIGANRMTENYFTLWDANMGTVAVLNGRTMAVEPDGSYTITVDADPAGGRPNHVQSTPAAQARVGRPSE